jgi:hypothetical protein
MAHNFTNIVGRPGFIKGCSNYYPLTYQPVGRKGFINGWQEFPDPNYTPSYPVCNEGLCDANAFARRYAEVQHLKRGLKNQIAANRCIDYADVQCAREQGFMGIQEMVNFSQRQAQILHLERGLKNVEFSGVGVGVAGCGVGVNGCGVGVNGVVPGYGVGINGYRR